MRGVKSLLQPETNPEEETRHRTFEGVSLLDSINILSKVNKNKRVPSDGTRRITVYRRLVTKYMKQVKRSTNSYLDLSR